MKFGLNIKSLGAAVLIMGLQPTVAHAQGLQGSTKLSSVNVDLVSSVLTKVKKSVVKVKSNDEFTCMGTVIESDGYILTKASELRGDKISCELPDGRVPTAKIVAKNEVFDLALLKIDVDDLIPVEWTLSNSAGLGSWVASVGPDKKAAAVGVVSVAARDIKLTDLDQVPAVRAAGGYMGILPAENPEGPGVLVQSYGNEKNGPAEKAGLKIDDVIVAINGKPVTKVLEFRETVANYNPNDVITLKVKRSSEELDIQVKLGKRPPIADRSDFQNRMGSTLSDRRTGFPNILQHDSVIKPSDCGAPLVDLDGHVLGINIARAGRTESYAIPSETLLPLLPGLLAGKTVTRQLSIFAALPSEADLRKQIKESEDNLRELQRSLAIKRQALAQIERDKSDLKKRLEEAKRVKAMEKLEEIPKPSEVKTPAEKKPEEKKK